MGYGVYYQNLSGGPETNTYVGTVVLSNSVPFVSGLNLVGSTVPISDSLESTNITLPFTSGDTLFLWRADGSGFDVAYYNGPGDWYDGVTFAAIPVPTVAVASGFYYQNLSGNSTNWVQNVQLQ